MQVALSVVLIWLAIGTACLLMQGPVLVLGVMATYNIRKHGTLPSIASDVRKLVTMIVIWPRWYLRASR